MFTGLLASEEADPRQDGTKEMPSGPPIHIISLVALRRAFVIEPPASRHQRDAAAAVRSSHTHHLFLFLSLVAL